MTTETSKPWTERDLELAQTAMFDVMIDKIVPSLHAADQGGEDDEQEA